MNDVNDEYYSPNQSPTTPVVSPVPKDNISRPCGDNMLKTMNPTPNGYNNIPNHKPKGDDQDVVMKHHEAAKHSEHHKNSSDHVKKKEGDSTKVKVSSSHSTSSKESSKDSSTKSDKEHHKEKKEHSSSHKDKDSSKSKEGKHDSQKHHSSGEKKDKSKTDSIKKEHISSGDKPKSDNFKENEKVKDSSSKESKHKDKDKHKEKHKDKDKSHKDKDKSHKDKDKSHKDKDKSHKDKDKESKHKEGEHKDKSEKNKGDSEISKEKHKDKHSEKHKDKHGDKHKDKHGEKHKDKHGEKHKDKHGEKHKSEDKSKSSDKSGESIKIKEEKHKGDSKSNEKSGESVKIKEEKLEDGSKQKSEKPQKDKPEKIKIKTEPVTSPKENGSSFKSTTIKNEPTTDDDYMPQPELNKRKSIKREYKEDSEEEEEEKPKPKKKVKNEKKRKVDSDYDDEEEEFTAKKPAKKVKKEKAGKAKVKQEPEVTSPKKRVKKEKEEEQEVWKWWEEEKLEDGVKWKTLSHKGPVFAPPYERVPKNVKFYYDGKHMPLSEATEEVAGFYGRMLDHEYTSKDVFNNNFFKDWRKVMTSEEKAAITDLSKCNFKDFDVYYKQKSEERKAMTKEQKLEIKKENERLTAEYGFCIIDGHKQKIGNFKIEPPGLFRGRGEHPKMGMLKRRIVAEDVLINIGKEADIPEPPPGHKWKEVRHDNKVSWLSSWTENILGSTKYIMLNPSSKLKGEKDWQKYETARKLKSHAHRIREEYTRDFKSKEMKVRQRAVALYFIDKLALRAGNEKDEDTADTVGCCSLRVEHITLDDEKDGQEYVVSFDFLGKDSIRYFNSVPVEKRAYKNLKLFMENKQPGDDLFDRLNTAILNKHLSELMEGLTAKVFRTYNASNTLQQQLDLLTKEDMSLPEKILAYNRANREVAILCNHQRAVPKGFSKSMENLKIKIDEKQAQIKECKKEVKELKRAAKESSRDQVLLDKKKKRLAQLEDQLKRLEIQATDREENKQIALGTSKLNYLDPRISVAWCKKWDVPIEKIYNKTQRDKFRWAIEMAGADYKF